MQIQPTIRLAAVVTFSCLWLASTSGCQSGPFKNRVFSGSGTTSMDRPLLPSTLAAMSNDGNATVRAQSPDGRSGTGGSGTVRGVNGQSASGQFWYGNNPNTAQSTQPNQLKQPTQRTTAAQPVYQAGNIGTNAAVGNVSNAGGFVNDNGGYSPGSVGNNRGVQQTAYQYPELAPTTQRGILSGNGLGSPNLGDPNQLNPIVQPFERGGNASVPLGNVAQPYFADADYADLDVSIAQTNTGRINIGGAYNSDNGIVGQFIIDEKDFDITRFPRNFQDILDGNAFRGGGQAFRLEVVPGQELQRYLVSFTEPYFLGTDYSFSASGYLFDRRYESWDENRLGGRLSFGRRLTPDLSISTGVRMERVDFDRDETTDNAPLVVGTEEKSNLFLGNVGLIRDTRDHPFLATAGSYFAATFSQAFGDYNFSRGDLEYRRYRLIYERPDRSGRHTISYGTKFGISGSDTPLFENYFAGGFSTLRGFDFRGAGPVDGPDDIRVGGRFQWLNTVEYMFPLTADDMVKAVVFCDFGAIDNEISIDRDNLRVAPGFGFRIHMPAAGIGAPLAFDFAFPVLSADTDEEQVFSFYLGVLR